jgi:hypothetical protein
MAENPTREPDYDVFISYSHRDRKWVERELVPNLEQVGLSVIIDYRDFSIGAPAIRNMEMAIEQSRHTIVVLTPNWVESQWTEFEGLVLGMADPGGRKRKVIPLLLEDCVIPPRMAILTHADFRSPAQRSAELTRLVNNLLENRGAPSPSSQLPRRSANPKWVFALVAVVAAAALLATVLFAVRPNHGDRAHVVTQPVNELEYSITVQRYQDHKPFREPFQLAGPALFEEDYRIAVNVTTPAPGYLYILNEGPLADRSSINVLYPAPGSPARISQGGSVRIPDAGWIVFDREQGTETLCLVLSATPVETLDSLKDDRTALLYGHVVAREPARLAALKETLRTLPGAPIDVQRDEDRKRTVIHSRGIIVHFIRLEHH